MGKRKNALKGTHTNNKGVVYMATIGAIDGAKVQEFMAEKVLSTAALSKKV